MAKKNMGKFLALTAISTAIAAGISYFLKYRSFHAELDEDFHDFEGDDDTFDGTLPHEGETAKRNYVPLGEKKEETPLKEAAQAGNEAMEKIKDATAQAAREVKEATEDLAEQAPKETKKAEESPKAVASTTIEEDTSVE